ncbi:MAG: hypothetical protein ACYCZU_12255 [Devosia sp.]
MPNAPHILETALLLLAAFLVGCVAGYLLRRLAATRSQPAGVVQPVAPLPAAATAQALVVAPKIEPVAAPALKPTPARRLAAAAAEPVARAASVPDVQTMQPARVAGETTSVKVIPAPETLAQEPPVAAPIEISWSELSGRPATPPPPSVREEETEDAAMRAVEGGWTPRPAPRAAPRRVELPEPVDGGEPAAPAESGVPETTGASPAEIEGALSAARSAVVAASAAAEAAIAEHVPAAEASEEPAPATDVSPRIGSRSPFGKPAGLGAPRDGRKDELRRIKGLTPRIEAALNDLGIFHFDQIAAWDKKAIVWIDSHLALKGRPGREKWIEQARQLAKLRMHALHAAKH